MTLAEAIEDIEDREGEHDVVLLPPANDPYASDEEVGGDDIGFIGNLDLPADVAGTVAWRVTVRLMMQLMKSPKNKGKNIGLAPYHFVS